MSTIKRLADNIFILDNGSEGYVDAGDTIYVEKNGEEGFQKDSDEILWEGFNQIPEEKTSANMTHFGLFQIMGLPVDIFSQYLSKYAELKKEAAIKDKDRATREAFWSHLRQFEEEGRLLLEKTPIMDTDRVINTVAAQIQRIDFDRSPVLRFQVQKKILHEMKKLRSETKWDPETLGAASTTISDILASLATLAKERPELQKEAQTLYEEEVVYLKGLETSGKGETSKSVSDETLGKLEEHVKKQITSLADILKIDPFYKNKAQLLHRMAELHIELTDIEVRRQKRTQPDYSRTIDLYKQMLQEFPDYERLDEVMFRLGEVLIQNGKEREGTSYFSRLIKQFPGSRYMAAAYKAVGDYYFNHDLLYAARTNYLTVTEIYGRGDAPKEIVLAARFRLAAIFAQIGENSLAIETFKEALTPQSH